MAGTCINPHVPADLFSESGGSSIVGYIDWFQNHVVSTGAGVNGLSGHSRAVVKNTNSPLSVHSHCRPQSTCTCTVSFSTVISAKCNILHTHKKTKQGHCFDCMKLLWTYVVINVFFVNGINMDYFSQNCLIMLNMEKQYFGPFVTAYIK